MKIKDLKERIKDLPDDMEIMYHDHHRLDVPGYYYAVVPIRKVKPKLVKTINGNLRVQSRPFKDEEANLVLIIE